MAVFNDYVNTLVQAGKRDKAIFCGGAQVEEIIVNVAVAAADDDGSIYRLVKDISPNLILISALICNDAITSGTSFDLGLYQTLALGGAVINKNVFMSAQDLSTGHVPGAWVNGLANLSVANYSKMIFEQAAHTILTKLTGYDIALTANTVGSAAGNVTVKMTFAQA